MKTTINYYAFTTKKNPGVYNKYLCTEAGWKPDGTMTVFEVGTDLFKKITTNNGVNGMTFAEYFSKNDGLRVPSAIQSEDGENWEEHECY